MHLDFFSRLPKVIRGKRIQMRTQLSSDSIKLLKRYGKEYFDSDLGYGGYYYDGRWKPVAEEIIEHYGLTSDSKVLEVGCAKGFLLFELFKLGIENVFGCDISSYAISHAPDEIRGNCRVLSADSLAYEDDTFDLVLSIDCIHNLDSLGVDNAIKEMARVSRNDIFIRIGSYRNEEEFRNITKWGVTSLTIERPEQWLERFKKHEYKGDYYFRFMQSLE